DDDAHRRNRTFEVAARIGERGRAGERVERATNVNFTGGVGETVRYKARDRDKRQQHDTRAHRERCEHPRQPIERKQKLGELHVAWIWSRQNKRSVALRRGKGGKYVKPQWLIFIAILRKQRVRGRR